MNIIKHYRGKPASEFYRNKNIILLSLLFTVLAILGFVVHSSFIEYASWVAILNLIIAIIFIAELYFEYLVLKPDKHGPLGFAHTLRDVIVILSLLPIFSLGISTFIASFIFLRLLKFYEQYRHFHHRRHIQYEEVYKNSLNLAVFIFIVTGLIFSFESPINPSIASYFDAFYFTVSTVSTTGYGDIIPATTIGRIFVTIMMLVGITLFLKLASSFSRERKLNKECEVCGLTIHDIDSVYCKRCGTPINKKAASVVSSDK